jgi:hypothetical protein
LNKSLAELFKQKYLLERERDREFTTNLKNSLWGVVGFSLCSAFRLILRRVIEGSEEFARKVDLTLPWIAIGLCFLVVFSAFFCCWKVSHYQKKINKIKKRIVEELTKS